jgi:hypothetical protein
MSRTIDIKWIALLSAVLAAVLLWSLSPAARVCAADEEAAKADDEAEEKDDKFPAWDKVTKDSKRLEGLFPLYFNEKEQKLYMEISQDQYDKELICPMAIARGAGLSYLGGDTLNFGDQWIPPTAFS